MELNRSDNSTANGEDLFEHYRLTADRGQSALRIDKYLTNHIEGASRSRIQAAADAGNIKVNGNPVKPNYKVKPGDEIVILMNYPRRELKIIPENIPLNIVYEDGYILVINKPPGLVVHPGHGNYTGTLANALAWHYKDLPLFNKKDPRPGLIHRIDKNTSGLLVIAKTEQAKSRLAGQFYAKTTERLYHALIWGSPKEKSGTITGNIGRSLNNRQIFTVFPGGEYGKNAVTHYKVLEDFDYVSLVECRLETGRTHQIRVHMKYINHPVFNDPEYGGDKILRGTTFAKYRQFIQNCFILLPRQALHAKTLGFKHPATGEKMLFNSSLPEDMTGVIEKWKNYIEYRNEQKT